MRNHITVGCLTISLNSVLNSTNPFLIVFRIPNRGTPRISLTPINRGILNSIHQAETLRKDIFIAAALSSNPRSEGIVN